MIYDLLIRNSSELLTCHATRVKRKAELEDLGVIKEGAILIHQGNIAAVGATQDFATTSAKRTIDAQNRVVMPGFVDPHTHLVFAGSREEEFEDRLSGKSYLDILAGGGGIFSTVNKTRKVSLSFLIEASLKKLDQLLEYGTTTVEIKSGYGLDYREELKLLTVIDELRKNHPIEIVKTFLGAHVYPKERSRSKYKKELFKMIADFNFDFCDIFIEKEAFSLVEAREILKHALKKGKKIKIHTEQFNNLGGSLLGSELKAVSVDHLDNISLKAIEHLVHSSTIGVLLPGVSFYLKSKKLPPVRKMIEKGMALALASDFNPGSCPTFNMQLIISLACLMFELLPTQAINMATINAAFAVDKADRIGSLISGKQADILILDVDSYKKLPYYFGSNHVKTVIKKGKIVKAQ